MHGVLRGRGPPLRQRGRRRRTVGGRRRQLSGPNGLLRGRLGRRVRHDRARSRTARRSAKPGAFVPRRQARRSAARAYGRDNSATAWWRRADAPVSCAASARVRPRGPRDRECRRRMRRRDFWRVDRNVAIGCRPNRRTAHVLHGPHERRASPRRALGADRRMGPIAAFLGCMPSRRRGQGGGPRQARGLARKRASARARSTERARSPKALLDVAGREHRAPTPNGRRARGRRSYRSASGRTA